MRLNGWQRIGVVLTGAWLVVCFSGLVIGLIAAIRDCHTPALYDCHFMKPIEVTIFVGFTVVPPAALWLVGALLLKLARWIAAGFAETRNTKR